MKILIIDDEKAIRRALREILEFEECHVEEAENGKEGIEKLQKNEYDLIFCDIKMPIMDGLDVLSNAMKLNIETPIIMISGHGNIETAVQAIKDGAFDFIEKPLDLNRILVTLRNATDRNKLVEETKSLKTVVKKFKGSSIVGETEAINKIKEMIEKVAPSDARVLVTGGNGSGKELVARSLHDNSNRKKMPFIEVNCAAIPSELIESELFGHVKGAFTSAIKDKKGKFQLASEGTLFLDEIGDMSASAQAKVLRALQENVIQRVGSEKDIKVDCRVIAATNKDLRKEINEGNFREDLFHRLAVILIHVPALNDRTEDIPLLANHFIKMICADQGVPTKSFDKSALDELQSINWTGNIRELRNVIERLVILCGPMISSDDVKLYSNSNK
ncbi:MAG: sigma-54-dependent Fis family transcriptional regulator [Flavobacteriales bacterium]|jgi:two-component system nitrogen regulation response regulator NtrX|nr:sigma-54-dependent Fis family transcriptional regulator [Flavobacteriales bacterium]MBT5933082.1 sigma-54-dependent Fis family transcriptional regulator [Flavobacteriales bacterium]MDC0460013.1 sigma-54 dependent transcriptional regulator [Crocinitomicaceae bacterium]